MKEKNIALYSCGMSRRDISEQSKNMYNIEISDDLVSKIVEKITPEIAGWQNPLLDAVYSFVFMDAIHYKVESQRDSKIVCAILPRSYKTGTSRGEKTCIFTKGCYTAKVVETIILSNPFKRFEDMGYMHHSKYLGTLQIDKSIMKSFDDNDTSDLLTYCAGALDKYWSRK